MTPTIIKGDDVKIGDNVRINISEYLKIGDRSIIRDNAIIEGRHVEIGKEAVIHEYSHIGGGSCFDWQSHLEIGDFLHLGKFAHINPARKILIGDECGFGDQTKLWGHGAYLSSYEGFPVVFDNTKIGDRVWIPNAWVNPGVTIGDDVVIAAFSLVNTDIPSGCLAGGVPARILKENVYPKELSPSEKRVIINKISYDIQLELLFQDETVIYNYDHGETVFDIKHRRVKGPSNQDTEKIKNQFRRNGIRFKYYSKNGRYVKW